jgi:hypothetical protein
MIYEFDVIACVSHALAVCSPCLARAIFNLGLSVPEHKTVLTFSQTEKEGLATSSVFATQRRSIPSNETQILTAYIPPVKR